MLRTLVADAKVSGHEVTVLLDARLSKLNPPIVSDCTVPVFQPQEAEKSLVHAAEINDAVYVIAPETGRTLESLVRLVRQTGKVSLNCEAGAIGQVADKAVLGETLKSHGLRMPEMMPFDVDRNLTEVKKAVKSRLSYPLVFKPADGVSCGGLSLVQEDAQVDGAIARIKAESAAKQFIVQELIRGEAVSVSLLCTRAEAVAISLNKQNVKLAAPDSASSYVGGAVPFNHPLKQEAFAAAEKVTRAFAGLRGYVGVDLVLAKEEPFVMDVNPRLTTSYVGLSRVAGFNVADAMFNAVLKGALPARQESKGFSCFSKVETSKPTVGAFRKAARAEGVVSPPFPLDDSSRSVSLVIGRGESMADARRRFEEAKKSLLDIISRGK
jgi:predicted ATP-grasp superfamily ATP-dependent carboligase